MCGIKKNVFTSLKIKAETVPFYIFIVWVQKCIKNTILILKVLNETSITIDSFNFVGN